MNRRQFLTRSRQQAKVVVARSLKVRNRLAQAVSHRPGAGAAEIRARLQVLSEALELGPDAPSAQVRVLLDRLATARVQDLWLTLSVLNAELPLPDDVIRLRRQIVLDGAASALSPLLVPVTRLGAPRHPQRQVRVSAQVLVDVEHTSRTGLATGIQRVTRETVRQWKARHPLVLVAWTPDRTALRELEPAQVQRTLGEQPTTRAHTAPAREQVIVPWQGTYLITEVIDEVARSHRLMALGRFGRCATGAMAYDLVPVNNAETVSAGVSEWFPWYLAFLRYVDRVATDSESAAREYRGWRTMLGAIGVSGPDILGIPLGVSVPADEDEVDVAGAREEFLVADLPMFLLVNSPEPRKNHLAVLHAAETAWRAGYQFSLTMIGGHGWRNEAFHARLAELKAAGRPIEFRTGVGDDLLWGAYRVAYASLNPSLQEGFGLTAAESLASGTPVICPGFGSLAEIAEGGGCLLIDPREDASITEAICRLLDDRALHAELSAQARARDIRTWESFAGALWDFLIDGKEGAK